MRVSHDTSFVFNSPDERHNYSLSSRAILIIQNYIDHGRYASSWPEATQANMDDVDAIMSQFQHDLSKPMKYAVMIDLTTGSAFPKPSDLYSAEFMTLYNGSGLVSLDFTGQFATISEVGFYEFEFARKSPYGQLYLSGTPIRCNFYLSGTNIPPSTFEYDRQSTHIVDARQQCWLTVKWLIPIVETTTFEFKYDWQPVTGHQAPEYVQWNGGEHESYYKITKLLSW